MDELTEWLVRCARQDTVAFQRLYQQASPKLYGLCLRLMRNDAELAEDVLQEGFVKIWNNAARYSADKGSAMTWMSTIVRNQALDKLRSAKSRPQLSDVEYETLEFASTDLTPDSLGELSQDSQRLMQCMEGLKEEQRECIMQAFYYGYTHDELANRLSRPLGTVKAWIRRGLEQLRLCLS